MYLTIWNHAIQALQIFREFYLHAQPNECKLDRWSTTLTTKWCNRLEQKHVIDTCQADCDKSTLTKEIVFRWRGSNPRCMLNGENFVHPSLLNWLLYILSVISIKCRKPFGSM